MVIQRSSVNESMSALPLKRIMATLRRLPVELMRRWTVSGTEIPPPFVA